MNQPRKVLCVISENQQAEYQAEFDLLNKMNVEIVFARSPDLSLPKIPEIDPAMVILGTQIEDYEGLEIMSMIMMKYKDFSRPIAILPDKEDGLPPMIHSKSPETGRSSVESGGFEKIVELLRATAGDLEPIVAAEPSDRSGSSSQAEKLFDTSEISDAIEAEALQQQASVKVDLEDIAVDIASAGPPAKKSKTGIVIGAVAAVVVIVAVALFFVLGGEKPSTETPAPPKAPAAEAPKPSVEPAPVQEQEKETVEAPKEVGEEEKPAGEEAAKETEEKPEVAAAPPDEFILPISFSKSGVSPRVQNERKLKEAVKLMKEHSSSRIECIGHASSEGETDNNYELAKLRAENAKKLLVDMGVDGASIEVKSQGADKPIATNDTEAGRTKNRRVSIKIVP